MADQRIGVYFTNPPSPRRPPDWWGYITGYIVPGLILLGILRLASWLLVE
jgi:hypothetical protein